MNLRATKYRYVIDSIQVPSTAMEAKALSLDLDRDEAGLGDNQIGLVLSVISSSSEYDLTAEVNSMINAGELLQIIDVQASSLTDASNVGVQVAMALDLDDNAADNHSGSEILAMDESVAPGLMSGTIEKGLITVELGSAPLGMTFPGLGKLFVFPLSNARLEARLTKEGIQGRIAGSISQEDVDQLLIPALAEGLGRAIETDCPAHRCDEPSFGAFLVALLDTDEPKDFEITEEELRSNRIVSDLLQPDLDLYDAAGALVPGCDGVKESLSISVGFTAVRAAFR